MSTNRRDDALEAALFDLGTALDLPPTPDLAAVVRARLAAQPARRLPQDQRVLLPWWRRRAVAIALVIIGLLVVVGGAAALRLGLPGLRIEFQGPAASPSASALTLSSPNIPANLGESITLEGARRAVTYPIYAPARPELGEPSVYLDRRPVGSQVALAYVDQAGQPTLLVTQTRTTEPPLEEVLTKLLSDKTDLEPVEVAGNPGFWISGQPHELLLNDGIGDYRHVMMRIVGDVLVWAQDGTLVRIESTLGKEATLEIAESMR